MGRFPRDGAQVTSYSQQDAEAYKTLFDSPAKLQDDRADPGFLLINRYSQSSLNRVEDYTSVEAFDVGSVEKEVVDQLTASLHTIGCDNDKVIEVTCKHVALLYFTSLQHSFLELGV